ncbi:uncharacterized protein LOC122854015 [Aphidius gifuensis]|uniref:uncharacterized protein LOC122854015 n=1 Tax=Aphidius gifuensis TaxID=684658 RepID=UPI001CDD0A26|nr:uncharacterized protein LOC122854015 [Aphidius gifuensis]
MVMKNNNYFGKDKIPLGSSILEVSKKIDNLERTIKATSKSSIREINRLIQYNQIMNQFDKNLNYVDNICTSHANNQLLSILDSIHRAVVPNNLATVGLFDALINNRQTKEDALICNITASLEQEIYGVYGMVSLAQVKGYTMARFSYEILKTMEQGQFVYEVNDLIDKFINVVTTIGVKATNIMSIASRDIRPCDPDNHKQGETYEQLNKFIQGFVTNEVSLNSQHTCDKTCESYKRTSLYPYETVPSKGIHNCQGSLHDCFEELGTTMCPPNNDANNDRRYGGFKGVTILLKKDEPDKGDVTKCSKHGNTLHEIFGNVQSGYLNVCSVCMCLCDDYNNIETARTFSLRKVETNIVENLVITGIKLVKKKRVFYIQTLQGKLEADGKILNTSLQWVSVADVDYKNPNVSKSDYHTLNYDERSVNLDTLASPDGYAMTGIRFLKIKGHLSLGIKVTPFNFTSGLLQGDENSEWITNSVNDRSEIVISNAGIPTLSRDENIIHMEKNTFVKFGWSDYLKDIQQTPIPFLDIQPVVADPPAPLSGAGIYYKGQPGFGGFVGLKLVAYSYIDLVTTKVGE